MFFPMKCYICNSPSKMMFVANDFISHEEFSVYKCEHCAVGFTYPQPKDINQYYPQTYRRFAPFTRRLLYFLFRLNVKSWVRKIGFTGSALEIGCGNGWMLNVLNELGWKVVGFERNEEQAKRVMDATGLPMHSGSLSQIKNEKFDLILLYNVIEHLVDPLSVLRECKDLLTERGVLIMSTQNLNSWQADFAKADWAHLDVPRHLFHFSEKSFHHILNSVGMRITRVTTVSLTYDAYGWIASFLNKMGFAHSRLADELMKDNFRGFLNPSGILMLFVSAVVAIPSFLLAPLSWLFKRGALIEVWAKKDS